MTTEARFLKLTAAVVTAAFMSTNVPAYALAPGSKFEKTDSIDEIQRVANRLHRVCYEAIKRHGISRDVQRNIADERFGELNQKLEAGDLAGALKANDEIRSAWANRDSFTGISYAIRDFSNAVEQRVANDSFINEQLKKLMHIIQASAPSNEDSDFVSYREGLLSEAEAYLKKGEFGAAYQALQELIYYVPTQPQKEYQVILSNFDLAFRRRLEKTREYEAARSRSDMIQRLLKRRARNPDEPQSLVVPDEVITPPGTGTGRIRVFEEELSLMPEALRDPIRELAGAGLVDKDTEDEALRASKDEVQLVCVLASGGLSRRGGIYLNHKRWIEKTLGWIRLGDLRLSQIAQRAKKFNKAALVIVESYFTHRRVNEVLDDARADVGVFGGAGKIRRIKSSLTPIWRLRDGSVHKPYSQDGLGVASHGDLFLQPLLAGAIGDLLNEAGGAKDNVYVATFNMNAVLSVPSPHLIGDFHNLRKRLKKDGRPVPFVAFQLVPAKGEKGGMLAYIKYNAKKVLQIIEGFLLSDSKKKAMASNPKEYPGFNTNHAVVALNDFVKCFFAGTGITAEDLTTEALKNSENFSRVLRVINEKVVVPAGPAELLNTDFRRKVGTFIEEKTWDGEKIAQVSTMLNALAIFTMRGYDPSVYYLSPRDIDPQKIERRFYGEYKERSQGQGPADSRDNFQRTADIFMEQGLLSLKSGRDGKEWLDKKNIIPGIHFRAGGQITGGRLSARVVLMNGDRIEKNLSIPKKADAYALTHALWQNLPDGARYGDIRVSESDAEIRVEIDVVPIASTGGKDSIRSSLIAPGSKFKQEKVRIYNGLEDVPGIAEALKRSKLKLVDKRGARRQAAEFLKGKKLPPEMLSRMEIYLVTPPAELAPPDFLGIMYISDEYSQCICVDDNRLYIAQPLVNYLTENKPDCLRDYLSAMIVYGAARLSGLSETEAEKMQEDFLESRGRKRDELISLLRELSHGIELSLGEVFWKQVKKFNRYSSSKALFKVKKDGRYIPISWAQAGRGVLQIGLGLMRLMHKGERIAIFSQNRPEAAYFDIAALSLGIVDVPLNPGASSEDIVTMLNDSRANVVVCGSEDDLNRVLRIKDKLPHVRKVVVIDAVPEELYSSFVMGVEDLKGLGRTLRKYDFMRRMNRVKLDDVATIMYTSGTSGAPKGICFTQKNVMAKRRSRGYVVSIDENDRLFCYLPLWHTFGRWLELWGSVYWGATYIFANSPRVDEILNDFQVERPTVFISVPSIWEEIYKEVMALAGEGAPDARIRDILERVTGGRLKKWALTAAGYLDPKIIAFFNRHGVPLSSGYGLTEVTGGLTMTRPGDYVEESIGQPLPGAEMRLGSGGVLYVRSPYIVPGYTDAARNAKKFSKGGWFNTGDVVSVGARGHMMIVGREGTKDIYKTKGGLTVSPQKVECKFQEDMGVKRAFLVGEGRSFNMLLVVPRMDVVGAAVFNEYFQGVLTRINPELGVGERVRRFAVIWDDFPAQLFSLGNKYKREEVVRHYRDVIEAVYRSDDEVLTCIEALEKSDDAAQDQVLIERLGELGDDRALGVLVRVLLEGEESFAAAIAIKKINSKLVKNAIQDQLAMMDDRGIMPTPEINGHLVDVLTYFGVRKNDLTKYIPRLSVRERKQLDEDVLYLNNVARRTLGGVQKVVRARVADSAKRSEIVRLAKDTLTHISFYVGEGTVRAKDRRIIVGFEKNPKGNGGVILISRRFMRSRAFERNKFSIVFYAALKMNENLQQLIGSLPDEFKCRDINIEAVKPEWVTPLAGSPTHQPADSARRSLLAPESRMGTTGSEARERSERFLIALMNLAFGENLYDDIGNVNSIMGALVKGSHQGASNLGPFIDNLKEKNRRFQEITRGMHSIFRACQNGRGFARVNGVPKEEDVPAWIMEFKEGAKEFQMTLWKIEQAIGVWLAKQQLERLPKLIRNMQEAVKEQLAFMDGAIGQEVFDLKDAFDKFEPTIKRMGLKLDIEPPKEKILVRGSIRNLTLAVWYLLENRLRQAYKARGAQAECRVRLFADDRNCYFEITDNGLTILDDVKDKIFDLGFALRPNDVEDKDSDPEPEPRRPAEGSIGASLACARFIVRDYGGDITFQNNPSFGATFTMRLPRAEKSVQLEGAATVRENL